MFTEDGSFRFIRFALEESDQAEYFLREEPKCREFQEEFKAKLKALMRKKCTDGDTKFLCDFVYQCTGQGYIPDVDTDMAADAIAKTPLLLLLLLPPPITIPLLPIKFPIINAPRGTNGGVVVTNNTMK